jgi:hypothetical protein
MMIADGEEFGEGIQIGTRNIISYDETEPASEMLLFSPSEMREAQAEHWRQTVDLIADSEQHLSLKNAIASHLWKKHGSG